LDDPNIWHDSGDGCTDDMPWDGQIRSFAVLLKLGQAFLQCEQAVFRVSW
jgi:hypothetical protein